MPDSLELPVALRALSETAGAFRKKRAAKILSLRPPRRSDGLIAATSLQREFTVVTRNTDDLECCGAHCFNPWDRK
jgi:predicted nucleic acid-binding protein